MKKLMLIMIFAFLFFLPALGVQAATGQNRSGQELSPPQEDLLRDHMADLDFTKMEKYINEINTQLDGYLPRLNLKNFIADVVTGKNELSVTTALQGMLKFLFSEVVANYKLLLQLLLLALACAVLENLQGAFDRGTTGKIAHAVVYLVLMTIAVSSFSFALKLGKEAIDNMVDFMYGILPLLFTLLAALGNIASATIFHPISFAVLAASSSIVKNIIFPLLFLSVVVGLVSNITDKFNVSRLSGFIKNIGMFLLGLLFTLFLGFLGIQGIGGSVADGVALRTAKFATGAAIPVVGKMFSDAIDAVAGTSLLLKNALGLVGVVIIFFLAVIPILKLLAIMMIYRLTAALAQPVVNEKIVKCLDHMANSIILVFGAVATVSLMFFFIVTIIVGAGNITVMMR